MRFVDDVSATLRDTRRALRLAAGCVTARPIHCIIQVSNRCNVSCRFCSFWEHPAPPRDEMTALEIESIAQQLAQAGSMVVSIEGGEPLLRPDIVEIVRAFAREHHPILFTNGWRVTETLARELWAAGLTQVGVSIDYPTGDRHDAQRGKEGTFDAALRAIDVLRDTSPRGRKSVTVMTVLTDENENDFEDLLRLSAARGVNHQCTLLSTIGDGRHARGPKRPNAGAGARLLELKRRYPHFVSFTGYLEGIERFLGGDVRTPCFAGERFLNIDHLGEVSPCIEKLHLSAGNIRREPWSVIGARLAAMEEPKTCTDCYTSCRGFVEEMSGAPRVRAWREMAHGFATLAPPRPARSAR